MPEHLEPVSGEEISWQVLRYVEQHFDCSLTLAELSRQTGISRYSLSRMFSQEIGSSFRSCVNEKRVACARRLLLSEGGSVSQIAYESGFGSLATFNRVFKKLCGMTPRAYRQQFSLR